VRPADVLREVDHRPWPLPGRSWVMAQRWHDLLFAHWPVVPEALRPLVPHALDLDTFEGQAWVGVVPFRMSGVRPRLLPAMPWLSAFPEMNVRTYVTVDGKPGVYFFSLDAGNPVAVAIARRLFHLPYFHAAMRCQRTDDGIAYGSQTTHDGHAAVLRATYRPTGPIFRAGPGSLARWLTERYCLYTTTQAGAVLRGEIHHPPWSLQPAAWEVAADTTATSHGIVLPDTSPLLHYSALQEVIVWWPERVR
jgi:uncharacterized protein YqjF (DUF2071 family)